MKKSLLVFALGMVVSYADTLVGSARATKPNMVVIENKSKHKLYGWMKLAGPRCSIVGIKSKVLLVIEPKSTKKVPSYNCCVDEMELRVPSFNKPGIRAVGNMKPCDDSDQKFEATVDKKGQVSVDRIWETL